MRVVIHKSGMLEMSIINVIFLTNVENCGRVLFTSLLTTTINWSSSIFTSIWTTNCTIISYMPGVNTAKTGVWKLTRTMLSTVSQSSISTARIIKWRYIADRPATLELHSSTRDCFLSTRDRDLSSNSVGASFPSTERSTLPQFQ